MVFRVICPGCGAPLRGDEGDSWLTCPHCGSEGPRAAPPGPEFGWRPTKGAALVVALALFLGLWVVCWSLAFCGGVRFEQLLIWLMVLGSPLALRLSHAHLERHLPSGTARALTVGLGTLLALAWLALLLADLAGG